MFDKKKRYQRSLSVTCFILTAIAICFLLLSAPEAYGQKKTIILVRHAEKDASSNPNDPGLSPEGRTRAENLAKRIKGYRVGAIYSTNYLRTRETVGPAAARRKKEVKTYDPKDQQALVNEIMNSKTKRFLVVGHSNTIPPLANLLVKKELFKNLEEEEFGAIWVIKIRNGKPPEVKILSY